MAAKKGEKFSGVQLPDGKKPHDPVTFGDLIALGLQVKLPEPAKDEAPKSDA